MKPMRSTMARSFEMLTAVRHLPSRLKIGFYPVRTSLSPTRSIRHRDPFAALMAIMIRLTLKLYRTTIFPAHNYRPMVDRAEYARRTPQVPWSEAGDW